MGGEFVLFGWVERDFVPGDCVAGVSPPFMGVAVGLRSANVDEWQSRVWAGRRAEVGIWCSLFGDVGWVWVGNCEVGKGEGCMSH